MRVIDATTIKEQGRTGSLWRPHASVWSLSLACDYFDMTATSPCHARIDSRDCPRIHACRADGLAPDRHGAIAIGLERRIQVD